MNIQICTIKKEIHLLDMVPLDTLIAELEKLIPSYKEYKLTTYYPYQTPVYPYMDYPTYPYQPYDPWKITYSPDDTIFETTVDVHGKAYSTSGFLQVVDSRGKRQ